MSGTDMRLRIIIPARATCNIVHGMWCTCTCTPHTLLLPGYMAHRVRVHRWLHAARATCSTQEHAVGVAIMNYSRIQAPGRGGACNYYPR